MDPFISRTFVPYAGERARAREAHSFTENVRIPFWIVCVFADVYEVTYCEGGLSDGPICSVCV